MVTLSKEKKLKVLRAGIRSGDVVVKSRRGLNALRIVDAGIRFN